VWKRITRRDGLVVKFAERTYLVESILVTESVMKVYVEAATWKLNLVVIVGGIRRL